MSKQAIGSHTLEQSKDDIVTAEGRWSYRMACAPIAQALRNHTGDMTSSCRLWHRELVDNASQWTPPS
jgi:hypothetical protein